MSTITTAYLDRFCRQAHRGGYSDNTEHSLRFQLAARASTGGERAGGQCERGGKGPGESETWQCACSARQRTARVRVWSVYKIICACVYGHTLSLSMRIPVPPMHSSPRVCTLVLFISNGINTLIHYTGNFIHYMQSIEFALWLIIIIIIIISYKAYYYY